jgi:hypothetical protein
VGSGIRYTKLKDLDDEDENGDGEQQLGEYGKVLWHRLREVMANAESVFPAHVRDLAPSKLRALGKTYPHQMDNTDARSIEDVLLEYQELAAIVESSKVCAEDCDPECEWNVRVHGRVLEVAFPRRKEHEARFKTM